MRTVLFAIALLGCGDNLGVRPAVDGAFGTTDDERGDHDARRVDAAAFDDADPTGRADAASDAMPSVVTITAYTGDTRAPLIFVAGQDGAGPWRALTSTNGVYALDVTSGPYGVAYVCAFLNDFSSGVTTGYGLAFRYDTSAAHSAFDIHCPATAAYGTVAVTIRKLATTSFATITIGDRMCRVDSTLQTTPCGGITPGTRDLVAILSSGTTVTGMAILRSISVTAGATTHVVLDARKDFSSVTTASVAVTGGAWNDTSVNGIGSLFTARGTTATLSPSLWGPGGTPYAVASPATLVSSDLYRLSGTSSGGSPFHSREVDHYQHVGGNVTVALPDIIVGGFDIPTTTPYVRAHLSIIPVAGASLYRGIVDGNLRWLDVALTSAWVGGAAEVSWLQPDFTGVAGWNSVWALPVGSTADWGATVTVSDRDPFATPDATWDGATVSSSTRYGWVTP